MQPTFTSRLPLLFVFVFVLCKNVFCDGVLSDLANTVSQIDCFVVSFTTVCCGKTLVTTHFDSLSLTHRLPGVNCAHCKLTLYFLTSYFSQILVL